MASRRYAKKPLTFAHPPIWIVFSLVIAGLMLLYLDDDKEQKITQPEVTPTPYTSTYKFPALPPTGQPIITPLAP